ncbi:hypothetical protein B0H10DRAFT_2105594 [Mycena sp. CBHHK59/15]|nr:hypothetical protein B0H10DRAFT_2105594 [Mycena sp. CBHHK59/15]
MSIAYAPTPTPYPLQMSKPSKPFFKRHKTTSDALLRNDIPSRSVSPAGSFYGNGLRPLDLPPRGVSPAGSFYSLSSTSSPSIESVSSSGSRNRPLPAPPSSNVGSTWLSRSPRSLTIVSPTASEFATPPDTPMDVSEAELRRRQLEKATRILGEAVPLELVFQSRFAKDFPDPPPRRTTDSPQPFDYPQTRITQTEGRAGKVARRASLSLSTFASKLRGASANSSDHSRQSSESSGSSDHGHQARLPPSPPFVHTRAPIPRRRSLILPSPITFAFPRSRTPSRNQALNPPTTPDGLVIDIRTAASSADGHDDPDPTPVREHPRSHFYSRSEVLPPRVVPLPADMPPRVHTPSRTYGHAHALSVADPYARPETPFADLDPLESDDYAPVSTQYLSPGISRKERGQGWSGEWNQRDMQDVIQKLRNLK